ncbi:retrotransposon protein, putative, unclassified [Senna tora]|uniref:Retrotransposon protein, putative, unclassified n=1 Tax=Senna tora TaxID=362788 RepID=A0A834WAA1_9FABA|nr:retrotransposon protein, putative, unclassified [Senna tora]
MMAGRELLKNGLYRSIGNGETTSIWHDPWIPGVQADTLNPLYENGWRPERVCELIDTNATGWDVIKLWAVFDTRNCEKIISVPPCRSNRADAWAWSGEVNGTFSVKSCYKLAMEERWKQMSLTTHIFCDVSAELWKSLWKLPVLSRFKTFLWRACLDILPTVDALERRGMSILDKCIWCNREDETAYHVLVECEVLNSVWNNAPFNFSGKNSHVSILEWMAVEWSEWKEGQRGCFMMALYYIWEMRNGKKFRGENANLNIIWRKVDRSWDEVNIAKTLSSTSQNQIPKLVWTKPLDPFIKLNVDIAMSYEGEGAVGGVFRDHEGLCVGAFAGKVAAMGDVALMEAVGLKRGIEVAREGGITHLLVESDSKLVMDMIHSACNHESRLSTICKSIVESCTKFSECEVGWVPRLCNSSAHSMARIALNLKEDKVWSDSVPIWLAETCIADLN